MNQSPSTQTLDSKPLRRWTRGRLVVGLLLVLGAAFGIFLWRVVRAWQSHQREQHVAATIESLGGTVHYDRQGPKTGSPLSLLPTPWRHVVTVEFGKRWKGTSEDLALISELTRVNNILLSGPQFTDDSIRRIGAIQQLRTIRLRDTQISPQGLARFAAAKNLQVLSVSGKAVDDDLLAALPSFSQLEKLELLDCQVTSEGLRYVARLSTLRSIAVDSSAIDDRAIPHLLKLTNLEVLELYSSSITDEGVARLAKLPRITRLSLYGTTMTDAGIAALTKNRTIRALRLGNVKLSDASIKQIGTMTGLEELDVYGAKISDDALQSLASLKKLKRLVVGPPVTERGARRLQAALPKCEIVCPGQRGITLVLPARK